MMRPDKRRIVLLSALTCFTLAAVIFLVWELILHNYYRAADWRTMHMLFLTRGITTSLILAAWAGYYVHSRGEKMARQMQQTEKMAGIGKIASGIAHQINTPLGSILLTSESLIVDAGDRADLREQAELIRRNAVYCKEVVYHLLQYATPNHQNPHEERLGDVIRRTLALLDKQLAARSIAVRIDGNGQNERVLCRGNQIEQLLFNLVQNAIDAQGQSGQIELVAARDNGRLVLSVSDSGPGLRAPDLERVFEPFYTTKSADKGTGLGLAIARRIAEQHDGTISAANRPTGGAQFTVSLPAAPGRG